MKKNKNLFISIILVFLPLIIKYTGMDTHIVQIYNEYQLTRVEQITIDQENLFGNTESNINNYGIVAENHEDIYYIEDLHLYRMDKDLTNEEVILDQPTNWGKDTLNVVDDWIFYRQGNKINRIKIGSSKIETIFRGYPIQMQVIGNDIFFINLSDDEQLYKMDVNGQNRQVLHAYKTHDIAIYKNKIYYSYQEDKQDFLGVMNTDGTGKQLLTNLITRYMVADEDYIYYIDHEEGISRLELNTNRIEKLSKDRVGKFLKDDQFIFYTLSEFDEDSPWRYKGLYRMDFDGSNVLIIDDQHYLDDPGIGITEDWIFYVAMDEKNPPELKILSKNGETP